MKFVSGAILSEVTSESASWVTGSAPTDTSDSSISCIPSTPRLSTFPSFSSETYVGIKTVKTLAAHHLLGRVKDTIVTQAVRCFPGSVPSSPLQLTLQPNSLATLTDTIVALICVVTLGLGATAEEAPSLPHQIYPLFPSSSHQTYPSSSPLPIKFIPSSLFPSLPYQTYFLFPSLSRIPSHSSLPPAHLTLWGHRVRRSTSVVESLLYSGFLYSVTWLLMKPHSDNFTTNSNTWHRHQRHRPNVNTALHRHAHPAATD
ncbi:hypothetical protein E2C01_033179 [Portunus trituberculatus]|uniref:Uncharacterized protein n=1 Tax=Portunus trituberculatus TaxID=210409 RepID=A0A5B7F1S4_PORTR|nr:hypothetical protein [Portunus trituberculatus]